MNTVKLRLIEAHPRDLLTSNTFVMDGVEVFLSSSSSYLNEPESWILPDGYEVAESVSGDMEIYTGKGNHCHIGCNGKTATLISSEGIVYMWKHRDMNEEDMAKMLMYSGHQVKLDGEIDLKLVRMLAESYEFTWDEEHKLYRKCLLNEEE